MEGKGRGDNRWACKARSAWPPAWDQHTALPAHHLDGAPPSSFPEQALPACLRPGRHPRLPGGLNAYSGYVLRATGSQHIS